MSHQQDSLTRRLAEALAEESPTKEARALLAKHQQLRREHGQEGLRAFGQLTDLAMASFAAMVDE